MMTQKLVDGLKARLLFLLDDANEIFFEARPWLLNPLAYDRKLTYGSTKKRDILPIARENQNRMEIHKTARALEKAIGLPVQKPVTQSQLLID